MSKRQRKTHYWQDARLPREQLVLFADTLEDRIPEDHPVRILDEILSRMDWTEWEAESHGCLSATVGIGALLLALARIASALEDIASAERKDTKCTDG